MLTDSSTTYTSFDDVVRPKRYVGRSRSCSIEWEILPPSLDLWVYIGGLYSVAGPLYLAVAQFPTPLTVPVHVRQFWSKPLYGQRYTDGERYLFMRLYQQESIRHIRLRTRYVSVHTINRSSARIAAQRYLEMLLYEFCYEFGLNPNTIPVNFAHRFLKNIGTSSFNIQVSHQPTFYHWYLNLVTLIQLHDHAAAWRTIYNRYGCNHSPRLIAAHKVQIIVRGPHPTFHRYELLRIPDWHYEGLTEKKRPYVIRAFYFIYPPIWWNETFGLLPYEPKDRRYKRDLRRQLDYSRRAVLDDIQRKMLSVEEWIEQYSGLTTDHDIKNLRRFLQQESALDCIL